MVYWIIVRRLGSLPISPEFNNVWDDDVIFAGGVELSLLAFLRKKM
jgi:ABC-type Fe3+-hydroxamate transport system substrate-binding protein